ncbi:hypothetical protein FHT86_001517 [Rhizobium sp. BK313]|nr:hypothetical protein [Rhizobium sp. BK313]
MRSTHKIIVTAMQNAFPHVEVVNPACLDDRIGKIGERDPESFVAKTRIGRFDDKTPRKSSILRLAYGLFLPFWEIAAHFLSANYAFLIQMNDSAIVSLECYHGFDTMI